MRQSKAKSIRRVLGLGRIPKELSKADRGFYRAIKKQYNKCASPQRATYLDDVSEKVAAIRRGIAAGLNQQVPSSGS